MTFHLHDARPSDESLMLAFSKGSLEAFAELFQRYNQPIFGYFGRRVAQRSVAEEFTQETFLALYRAGSRYEPRALFRTYLDALAMKILHGYRRKASFRDAFLGSQASGAEAGKQDSTESSSRVRQAVEKLNAFDREVLLLREFEQLSYAEISDPLNLPLNAVRSRLFRARLALRDLLRLAATTLQDGTILTERGERA